jgi:hypothetical protein
VKEVAVRHARRLYRLAAISNFVVTVPVFLAYNAYVNRFFDARPNYPFLVWIWSGMAFLWGVSFLEIAHDPVAAYPLLKYSWLEKCVTSASVITAFVIGDIPGRILVGAVFTDVIWIPLFMRAHRGLARELRAGRKGRADAHVG